LVCLVEEVLLLQGGEDLGIVISWQKEVLDLGENNLGEAVTIVDRLSN